MLILLRNISVGILLGAMVGGSLYWVVLHTCCRRLRRLQLAARGNGEINELKVLIAKSPRDSGVLNAIEGGANAERA